MTAADRHIASRLIVSDIGDKDQSGVRVRILCLTYSISPYHEAVAEVFTDGS